MKRLRFPKKVIDAVAGCVRHHMQLKDAQRMRTATLRKLFLRPYFMTELELHRIDCLCSSGNLDNYYFLKDQYSDFLGNPKLVNPFISGDDLISLRQSPGPNFGRILKEARELQLEGKFASREQALDWLQSELGNVKK